MTVEKKWKWMKFFLTGLEKGQIILGYLFLTKFDLSCDWKIGHLQERKVRIQTVKPHTMSECQGEQHTKRERA
jgi:hypothetical protein